MAKDFKYIDSVSTIDNIFNSYLEETIILKLIEPGESYQWKGCKKNIGTIGDQEGMFFLPKDEIKDIWFPTSIEIKPEPFEITFDHRGDIYAREFRDREIKTIFNAI